MKRRNYISTALAVAGCGAVAGCTANDDVGEPYSDGYSFYKEADKELPYNNYKEAIQYYTTALEKFRTARSNAKKDEVKGYCDSAAKKTIHRRELAKHQKNDQDLQAITAGQAAKDYTLVEPSRVKEASKSLPF